MSLADSIQFEVPITCTAEGKSIVLDPGRYLQESDWQEWDGNIADMQNTITRVESENSSLKESAKSGGSWKLVATSAVLGILLGAYGYRKVSN